ncbi:hypothetical protein V6N13_147961 [Hibiscus sabdariffa]|uniref:Uncharacterized protein n=1 Tax=Hibiscus sabdariffa TaxID=183260 RepID=A0ABR2TXN4_9ROSI
MEIHVKLGEERERLYHSRQIWVLQREKKRKKKEIPVTGLTLLTSGIKNLKEESGSTRSRTNCSRTWTTSALSVLTGGDQQQQTARKQRRC